MPRRLMISMTDENIEKFYLHEATGDIGFMTKRLILSGITDEECLEKNETKGVRPLVSRAASVTRAVYAIC